MAATKQRGRAAQPALARAGRAAGAVLAPAAAAVFRLASLAERALRSGLGTVAAALAAVTAVLSGLLTPERAVLGVTLATAACLVVSQFSDYRGVEVGQAGYAEVTAITPPPQVDVETPVDAHGYLLVPLAAIAAGLAFAALLSRRWQLGRLVALTGLIAVAITLLNDLPKGLDEGPAGIGYAGAHAILSEGFYAQLASSAALVLCGLLLSLTLRRGDRRAGRRRPAPRRRRRPGEAPSLARSGT
jgi:hypothetical protein